MTNNRVWFNYMEPGTISLKEKLERVQKKRIRFIRYKKRLTITLDDPLIKSLQFNLELDSLNPNILFLIAFLSTYLITILAHVLYFIQVPTKIHGQIPT